MTMDLFVNRSENNAINKDLAYVGTLQGTMKQATSILNPNIIIEMDNGIINYNINIQANDEDVAYTDADLEYDLSININYSIFDCNYVYITEFQRYYFIDNIVIQNNKLFMLILSVDANESHKNKFMNLDAYISRNEFDYNPYIQDNLLNTIYDKDVVIEYFVGGAGHAGSMDALTLTIDPVYSPNYNYIVSVMSEFSGLASSGRVNTLNTWDYPLLNAEITGMGLSTHYYICDKMAINELLNNVYNDDTLRGFIKNILVFPFNIDYPFRTNTHNDTYIKIGDTKIDIPTILGHRYLEQARTPFLQFLSNSFHITPYYNDFRDFSPYTKYEIYIRGFGYAELSGEMILNHDLLVFYSCNYETGDATAYIYDANLEKIIFQTPCNICAKVGISSTNTKELENQKLSATLNCAIGSLSSIISIGAGAYTGNGFAVAQGITGLASTITNTISTFNQMYLLGRVESTSGIESLNTWAMPHFRVTRIKSCEYDDNYFKLYGRPLNEKRKLSDLKGFTSVADIHLENINATKEEIQSIANSLKNGVIIK